MFASQVRDTVTLSNGTDTVVIKKLGWKAQEAAADELQRRAHERLAQLGKGFVDVQQAIVKGLEANGGVDAVRKLAEANPLMRFDRSTLLIRGIVSWSLSDKPTPDEIEDLDDADAKLLAERIYDLFRPKTEAERKND